jgi:hypothetical protein
MDESSELYERLGHHAERPRFRMSEIRLGPVQRRRRHLVTNVGTDPANFLVL